MPTEELSRETTQRAEDQTVLAALDVGTHLGIWKVHVAAEMGTLYHSLLALPILMFCHTAGTQHCSALVGTLQIDLGIEPIGTLRAVLERDTIQSCELSTIVYRTFEFPTV